MTTEITDLIGDAVAAFERGHQGVKPTVLKLGRNQRGRLARHVAEQGVRKTGAVASPTYDSMTIEEIDVESCLQVE